MSEIVTEICVICGEYPAVLRNRRYGIVCRRCSKRIDTWGIDGAIKLLEFARDGKDIDIEDAKSFCKEHYAGKAIRSAEKVATMRISIEVLGGRKGMIVGRHRRKKPTWQLNRLANVSYHIRHKTKDEKCSECGATENLHLHHVVPASWGGVEIDPNNVVTLCGPCHMEAHKKLKQVLNRGRLIEYLRPHYDEIRQLVLSVI